MPCMRRAPPARPIRPLDTPQPQRIDAIGHAPEDNDTAMTGASTAPASHVPSRRVLIIEDEVLIAMVLEDMLEMLGHVIVATPGGFVEAEAAITAGGFDLVIADVNLGADPVYPLAERVLAAGVQLILATGSHRDTLPERFVGLPVLEKPYALNAVEAALENLP